MCQAWYLGRGFTRHKTIPAPRELIYNEHTGEKHRGTEIFGDLLNSPLVPPWFIYDSAPESEAPEASL